MSGADGYYSLHNHLPMNTLRSTVLLSKRTALYGNMLQVEVGVWAQDWEIYLASFV